MLTSALLALALAQTPQHRLFMQPNLPRTTLAYFEFAPASGAGMTSACACTTPTGAKGEALGGGGGGYAFRPEDVSFRTPVSFPPHERGVEIEIDLGMGGGGEACVLGSDLTHEYVAENLSYRS